jgi:hypothetical protein
VCRREFAVLNALEEFNHSVKLSPSNIGSTTVKESILKNGIKIISSHNEHAKVIKHSMTAS